MEALRIRCRALFRSTLTLFVVVELLLTVAKVEEPVVVEVGGGNGDGVRSDGVGGNSAGGELTGAVADEATRTVPGPLGLSSVTAMSSIPLWEKFPTTRDVAYGVLWLLAKISVAFWKRCRSPFPRRTVTRPGCWPVRCRCARRPDRVCRHWSDPPEPHRSGSHRRCSASGPRTTVRRYCSCSGTRRHCCSSRRLWRPRCPACRLR